MRLIFPHLLNRPPNRPKLLLRHPPRRVGHFLFANANLPRRKIRIVKLPPTINHRRIPPLRHIRQNLLHRRNLLRPLALPQSQRHRIERQIAQKHRNRRTVLFIRKIQNRNHAKILATDEYRCTQIDEMPTPPI